MNGKLLTLILALALIFSVGTTRTFAQTSPGGTSTPGYDFKTATLGDLKDLQSKFLDLAKAFPPEKYTWRPGDGVRSVSEVLLHVANEDFFVPTMAGAAPAEGFNRNGYETSTTDKDKLLTRSRNRLPTPRRLYRQCRTPTSLALASSTAVIQRATAFCSL